MSVVLSSRHLKTDTPMINLHTGLAAARRRFYGRCGGCKSASRMEL